MAINFTDVYENASFLDEIMKTHTDIPDEVMEMGMFGYLNTVHRNILQNSAITAAENALEALPTKAKYARNVLTHAHSVGLETNATPAYMKVVIYLPEDRLEANLDYKGKFVIDKDFTIKIGEYEFHFDYDIIIRKVTLPNKETIYTAQYDISKENPLSNIKSPYLQSIGRFTIVNTKVLALQTQIRQVEINRLEIPLTTSNPLTNKTFQFEFDNQLAAFDIEVEEGDNTYQLNPVYDGLIDKVSSYYCNYLFLEDNKIRVIFRKESYQPRMNCNVKVNVYTTHGNEGNFTYLSNIQLDLRSEKYDYKGIWMLVKPISDSEYGENSKSVTELKKLIPTEMLARGTITNTRDLNNFFNSINTDDRRIHFIKKLDSLERLYYSYMALKSNGNIIPTNTIDIRLGRNQFDNIEHFNYLLYPGNCIYYRRNDFGKIVTTYLSEEETMNEYRSSGFLYFNPFLLIVNKNPFYVSYLINIFRVVRDVSFEYINQNSPLQFISSNIEWKREYFTDRDTYKLSINLEQNINSDNFNILIKEADESGYETVIGAKMQVIAVLKNDSGLPYRYTKAEFMSYDQTTQSFSYQFKIETDNMMDDEMKVKLLNVYDIMKVNKAYGYFPPTTNIDIYVFTQLEEDYGRGETDKLIPGMEGWTCTNKYSIMDGVPLYINYSKIISTFVNVEQGSDNDLTYTIKKVPVIKYDYILSEDRIQDVVNQLELVRSYIEYKLSTIEDGFGADIKLFNTWGPAKFFRLDASSYLNNVSLSLKFKTKLRVTASETCIDDMINYVKNYIEDFNKIDDTDFDMPLLEASVNDEFKDQIYYFEFLGFNGYGPAYGHIIRDEFEKEITKVPEMLSISVTDKDLPDIEITTVL